MAKALRKRGKSEKSQPGQKCRFCRALGTETPRLSPHSELRSHLHQLPLKSVGIFKASWEL